MKKIRKKIAKFVQKYSFRGKFLNDSYSQQGEDILLSNLLPQKKGFYVDIGAHHPKRYSNTHKFYRKGWRGINVDSAPGMKKIFQKFRPRDINLEIGVGKDFDKLTYYIFNEPALNSFDSDIINIYKDHPNFKVIDKKMIDIIPLYEILDKNLPKNTEIDFLNIDVEGLDYQILQSNNWKKYRPKIILCEAFGDYNLDSRTIYESDIYKFLHERNYKLISVVGCTMFFILN